MTTYISEVDKIEYDDGLLSEGISAFLVNVKLAGGVEIERGMILCKNTAGYAPVSSAADAEKSLLIASLNEDSSATITAAYSSGRFHEDKIKIGNLDIEDFRDSLRKYDIILVQRKEQ